MYVPTSKKEKNIANELEGKLAQPYNFYIQLGDVNPREIHRTNKKYMKMNFIVN